ncbi:S1C family serine protease [Vagococcus salmoninarum]|uniref:S1C family serine protease n=1 Tax=Vagococcus salmoninarum TaxID=2739 RepID=UPI003F9C2879
MMRKDVTPYTPKKKRGSFAGGLLGGIIGGALTVGVGFLLLKPGLSAVTDELTTNPTTPDNKSAQISNIKYDVESDTSKAVEKVQDAVVSVVNLKKKQQISDFGSFFGQMEEPQEKAEQSSDEADLEASSEGSGVIYRKDGDKAYVVTNNHVVDGSDALEVLLTDGSKIKAKLIGKDAYSDLAVLEIDASKVKTTAEFGDSDTVKVGEPAIAIGSPLGSIYANSATQGIISAKDRKITNKNESNQDVNINALQTDAAINPGNSGGPLVNVAGQVIGINSIKITQAASGVSAEGMGFSIPSNDVVAIISQLEKDGKVSRPMLGVTMTDLSTISSEQQEKILKVPAEVTAGVVIRSIQPASPAEKAGIQQYDVIVGIDDAEITSGTDLQSALYKKKVGDKIKVNLYREKDKKTIEVELSLDQDALSKNE